MSITDELREYVIRVHRNGWVKLPVDADGVPIHVGDEVKLEHSGRVTTVTNINYNEYGWQVYCAEGGGFDKDTRCRHVQPDTWERIIEDAANLVRGDNESVVGLVERCRRLAGESMNITDELRKLVRDMAAVICVYDQCVTVDDCPPALPMFADKMRELDVEVD